MRDSSVDEILVGASPKRYICEIHREIYDLIEKRLQGEEKEKCLNLISEAFWAGKRMSDRLNDLRAGWQKSEDWQDNPDFMEDIVKRAARLHLLTPVRSVNIETIDYCNRKCEWCPNKNRETSPNNLMSGPTITRILRQLLEYDYRGEIHLFLNGEPTLDPRLLKIVRTTKDILPKNYTRIVTNGAGLDPDKLQELFDAGLDSVHLNHYDGTHAGIEKARDATFPKLSHFGMKALLPSFYNRAGKVDFTPARKANKCDNFLHKLVFNWRGDLILCCSDFNSEVVFGNINESALSIIMASKLYREYYYAHRDGPKKAKELHLCKECNLI